MPSHHRSVIAVLALAAACTSGPSATEPSARPTAARAVAVAARDTVISVGDSLSVRVAFTLVVDQVQAELTVRNVASRRVRLSWGGCPVSLQLFRAPDLAGSPAFSDIAERACPAALITATLDPGVALPTSEFVRQVPTARILADSLPVGQYQAAARVAFQPTAILVPLGAVELRP